MEQTATEGMMSGITEERGTVANTGGSTQLSIVRYRVLIQM